MILKSDLMIIERHYMLLVLVVLYSLLTQVIKLE